MPLDFNDIAPQIISMGEHLKTKGDDRKSALKTALENLASPKLDTDQLQKRIETAKATWLLPGVRESISTRKTAPPCPKDYAVIGVDGSHIDVDRHQSAHCFLINVGGITLQYGADGGADLFNEVKLYFKDEEIALAGSDGRKVNIDREVLGTKRNVEELRMLSEKMIALETRNPVIGLLDGTLTLWGIIGEEYEEIIIEQLINKGLLKYLDNLHEACRKRPLAMGSYISFPRSTEVVNILRVLICPHETVNCDKFCGHGEEKPCDAVGVLNDRDILTDYLDTGERSAIFYSRSSIMKSYGEHKVNFFYIKLEDEIARMEIPQWIAENPEYVDLVHSVLLKQCELGQGYPVALMESHEKAVITGAERQQFWDLVERLLEAEGLEIHTSAKNRSKKLPAV
jgi:hypothetical protein